MSKQYSTASIADPNTYLTPDIHGLAFYKRSMLDLQKKYSIILCNILDEYISAKNDLLNKVSKSQLRQSHQSSSSKNAFSTGGSVSDLQEISSLENYQSLIEVRSEIGSFEEFQPNLELASIDDIKYNSIAKNTPFRNHFVYGKATNQKSNEFSYSSKFGNLSPAFSGESYKIQQCAENDWVDDRHSHITAAGQCITKSSDYVESDNVILLESSSFDEKMSSNADFSAHSIEEAYKHHLEFVSMSGNQRQIDSSYKSRISMLTPHKELTDMKVYTYNSDLNETRDFENHRQLSNNNCKNLGIVPEKGGSGALKASTLEKILSKKRLGFGSSSSSDSFQPSEHFKDFFSRCQNLEKSDRHDLQTGFKKSSRGFNRAAGYESDQNLNKIPLSTQEKKANLSQMVKKTFHDKWLEELDDTQPLVTRTKGSKITLDVCLSSIKGKNVPDYTSMTLGQLKNEAKKYGLRTNTSKRLLCIQLTKIFNTLNPESAAFYSNSPLPAEIYDSTVISGSYKSYEKHVPEQNNSSLSTTTLLAKQSKENADLFRILLKLFANDEEIYSKIILYRPINLTYLLDRVANWGVKCTKQSLQTFLDSQVSFLY